MIRCAFGAATDTGRVRKANEDSYLVTPVLYAVADGMGGHGAGDVASAVAINVLAAHARDPLSENAVLAALDDANHAVIESPAAADMGTTVTGLAILPAPEGSQLMVFNVGDSRVYRLAGGRLDQVTVDHSAVQELVLAGAITPEEARVHPRRNIVTRALGASTLLRPDHWLLPANAGDRYLLCTDGLSSELPDDAIAALLAAGTPQQAASALVTAANDAGGHDNVTAVVVDVAGDDPA
ncbi:MAG TPA: protein phosphatase 2C domain-containing protein [Trebonia sp.]|nr:protein phosphatase 2C domain-containing protein [Trebonia sp.]